MQNKLVSVLIPVYNVEAYLERCFTSVINQSYKNIEIIVIDDGSTDKSAEICDRYALNDNRIRLIHKKNEGLVRARKEALNLACGEYVLVVDSDDWIEKTMIEHMVEKIQRNDADFVESSYFYEQDDEENFKEVKAEKIILDVIGRSSLINDWLLRGMDCQIKNAIWSKLYKLEILKEAYKNVPNDLSYGEDFICFINLISIAQKVIVTDKIFYHYSYRKDSISRNNTPDKVRKYNEMLCLCTRTIEKLYKEIDLRTIDIWYVKRLQNIVYSFGVDECEYLKYQLKNIDQFRNKKIVLYGAGKVGKDVYTQIARIEDTNIVAWVDKNAENCQYDFYKVKSIDILNKVQYDEIIVSVLKDNLYLKIKDELFKFGIPEDKIKKVEIKEQKIKETENQNNIIKVIGGLGNQMFQYALYRVMQQKGMNVQLNLEFYNKNKERVFLLNEIFDLDELYIDTEKKYDNYKSIFSYRKLYKEIQDGCFDANVFNQTNTSFIGYWQSEKYFKEIEEIIRNDFKFKIKDEELNEFTKKIEYDCETVSIHIRRGDYLENLEMYGNICTLDYYQKAINFFLNENSETKFYVFSNDMDWVKENIKIPNCVYVESNLFHNYKDWYDMYLMSCCKNNIIANSSFSWWGAWLNENKGKKVIAPQRWLNKKQTPDIWCENWIKIE